MAITLNTTPDMLAMHMTNGLHGEIERAIRAQFQMHADKIVAEAARELASKIHGYVHSFTDCHGDLTITLILDGVKQGIVD
jgi:hypothetical protein